MLSVKRLNWTDICGSFRVNMTKTRQSANGPEGDTIYAGRFQPFREHTKRLIMGR
ncbi:MAG: hypothetical protein Pars92KO_23560 [Parasphingorhabdus sp.]